MSIFTTEHLKLREFKLKDAAFILTLVNQPLWLANIGDKKVHDLAAAKNYLINGPIKSYSENGFGLYLVELKSNGVAIGMCGLIKRQGVSFPEIGYALMPEFFGQGLATEAAKATIEYAKDKLQIAKIVATTSKNNVGSIRVLEKIGFCFDSMIDLDGYDEPSCYFVLNN